MATALRWCKALSGPMLALASLLILPTQLHSQSWIPPAKQRPAELRSVLSPTGIQHPKYVEYLSRRNGGPVPLQVPIHRAPRAVIVEAEPNDTTVEANQVELGDAVNGVIDPTRDVDFFTIDLAGGTTIDLDVDAQRLGSPLDAVIALLDRDGETVLEWNDDSDGLDSRIVYTVTADGHYYVGIADLGGRGGSQYTYTLRFDVFTVTEVEPNNSAEDANLVAIDDTVTGVINPAGDIDYYAFDFASEMLLVAELSTFELGSYFDGQLVLYGVDGTTVLDSVSSYTGQPQMRSYITAAGRYFLSVMGADDYSSGLYAVRLSAVAPGPGDPATVFASGLGDPWRMVAGETGELFVIDWSMSRVLEVGPNGSVSTLASGLGSMWDIAFDGCGDLLVTGWDQQWGLATVWEISPEGAISTFAVDPTGSFDNLAIGPDGDVWISGCTSDYCPVIRRFDPVGQLKETITIAGSWPEKLEFAPDGDLHYGTWEGIYRLANGVPELVINTEEGTQGLAFDEDGYLYVANGWRGTITLYDPSYAVAESPFAMMNLSGPIHLAFGRNSAGAVTSRLFATNMGYDVQVAPQFAGAVLEVNPSGVRAPGMRVGADLLRVERPSLDTAVVGTPYSAALHVADATGAAVWSIAVDSLPPGLTLSPSAGVVAGVPQVPGDFSFAVRVASEGEYGYRRMTVTVRTPQLTESDAIDGLLGKPGRLTPELEAYLDIQGNGNGTYDVGDLRAFLQSRGVLSTSADLPDVVVARERSDGS